MNTFSNPQKSGYDGAVEENFYEAIHGSETFKKCTKCHSVKSSHDFHPSKHNKDGLTSHCKECRNAQRREYGARNRDSLHEKKRIWYVGHRAEEIAKAKDSQLKIRYGITLFDYDKIFDEQSGVCAICGNPPGDKFALSVDHDHKTGEVRGLLCGACNFILGHAKDNPELLRKAADYLENHG